jgi:hypothetical protein
MSQWSWLNSKSYSHGFALRVLLKAVVLFVLANLIFALVDPLPVINRLSLYGWLVPPRLRLPYGENADLSYNIGLSSLDSMFASHTISTPKPSDEFRVLMLGDSSIWGFLLRPSETTAAQLDQGGYRSADGRRIQVYNLGYPEMSLTKDLLLLDYALHYQPDLIVWMFTLESFAPENQLAPFIVRQNPAPVRRLADTYSLSFEAPLPPEPTFLERTLIGKRRDLADWLRFQLYGFAWASTGIDQYYPDSYDLRTSDFEADLSWHTFIEPTAFTISDVAFDVLAAGVARAGDVPVLLVNEPMFISSGQNSDLRYNFFYPRWAYDRYRDLLIDTVEAEGWTLLDLWDTISPDEFTDSPVHLTPFGAHQVAELLAPVLQSQP